MSAIDKETKKRLLQDARNNRLANKYKDPKGVVKGRITLITNGVSTRFKVPEDIVYMELQDRSNKNLIIKIGSPTSLPKPTKMIK